MEYWIKAEITLDPDDIKSKIDEIVQNKEKLKDLEDVKKKADDALLEITRLKKELEKSKSDADQLRLTKAYSYETDALSATDWYYKVLEKNKELVELNELLQKSNRELLKRPLSIEEMKKMRL